MNKLLKHQPGSSVIISQATKCKQIHYIIIKPLALFSVPHTNAFNNWIKHWISLCQLKHVMPGFLGTIVHNCITTSLDTTLMQCTLHRFITKCDIHNILWLHKYCINKLYACSDDWSVPRGGHTFKVVVTMVTNTTINL